MPSTALNGEWGMLRTQMDGSSQLTRPVGWLSKILYLLRGSVLNLVNRAAHSTHEASYVGCLNLSSQKSYEEELTDRTISLNEAEKASLKLGSVIAVVRTYMSLNVNLSFVVATLL